MQRTPNATPLVLPLRSVATRVGHDAVWLAIAGLFYIVEGAVKLTEFSPARYLRARRRTMLNQAARTHSAGAYAR